MNRVVVTGLGAISAAGVDLNSNWERVLSGKTAISRITFFDPSDLPVHIAGQAPDIDATNSLEFKEAQRASRFIKFAAHASKEAIESSGLKFNDSDTSNWGTAIGVGMGGLDDIEKNTMILNTKGAKRISPFFLPYTLANLASGVVSKYYNLKGPNICPTTACASGTHGVGEGWMYIANGWADVMVVGGAESALSPLGIASFSSMKALCAENDNPERASRPFDATRSGFVMGEGAGILVLESLKHAEARGAEIIAEVVGYGLSGDAHHITAPAPGGEGGERCMRMALKTAGIQPEEVDYINAHGTSTSLNDWYESTAIYNIFGDRAKKELSISSTKGVTGHCLGAAGGIEAVYSALAVKNNVVPPTANYQDADPNCPLNYTVNGAEKKEIRYALSNSFGFGGTNASILLKKFEN